MILVAVLALVASACAAGLDAVDEREDDAAPGTTTTQLSSPSQSQSPVTEGSTPTTSPGGETSEEGSGSNVTEPPATDQPPTTEQPAGTDSGSVEEGTTTTPPPPAPSTGTGTYNGPLGDLVTVALADLAGRLGVSAAQIEVASAESVVWPDGSLGCPQPDMSYTQVQVDGAKIVLSFDGRTYNYHSGGSRDPFLCVPAKTVPGQTTTTLIGGSFDE